MLTCLACARGQVAAALVIGVVSGIYIWTPIIDNVQEQINAGEATRRSAHTARWAAGWEGQPTLPTGAVSKDKDRQ